MILPEIITDSGSDICSNVLLHLKMKLQAKLYSKGGIIPKSVHQPDNSDVWSSKIFTDAPIGVVQRTVHDTALVWIILMSVSLRDRLHFKSYQNRFLSHSSTVFNASATVATLYLSLVYPSVVRSTSMPSGNACDTIKVASQWFQNMLLLHLLPASSWVDIIPPTKVKLVTKSF